MSKKLNSIDSHVIIWFILTPYLNPTFKSLLPSTLKPQDYTSPNKSALTHKVIRPLLHVYCIKYRRKFISLCLSIDYSLFTYLHIFVYELVNDCAYIIPLCIYLALMWNYKTFTVFKISIIYIHYVKL